MIVRHPNKKDPKMDPNLENHPCGEAIVLGGLGRVR